MDMAKMMEMMQGMKGGGGGGPGGGMDMSKMMEVMGVGGDDAGDGKAPEAGAADELPSVEKGEADPLCPVVPSGKLKIEKIGEIDTNAMTTKEAASTAATTTTTVDDHELIESDLKVVDV